MNTTKTLVNLDLNSCISVQVLIHDLDTKCIYGTVVLTTDIFFSLVSDTVICTLVLPSRNMSLYSRHALSVIQSDELRLMRCSLFSSPHYRVDTQSSIVIKHASLSYLPFSRTNFSLRGGFRFVGLYYFWFMSAFQQRYGFTSCMNHVKLQSNYTAFGFYRGSYIVEMAVNMKTQYLYKVFQAFLLHQLKVNKLLKSPSLYLEITCYLLILNENFQTVEQSFKYLLFSNIENNSTFVQSISQDHISEIYKLIYCK